MPVSFPPSLPLERFGDFSLSDARQAAILAVENLECKEQEDVDAARARIMYMGIWDSFIDLVCRDGAKQEALRAIANKVIADRVVQWAVDTHKPASDVLALELSRQRKQRDFIDMLTPDGLESILQKHQGNDHLVRFMPTTDNAAVNRLLCIIAPHGMAADLVRKYQGPDRAGFALETWAQDAKEHSKKAELYTDAAREWQGRQPGREMSALLNAAKCHGAHAARCVGGPLSGVAFEAASNAERAAVAAYRAAAKAAQLLSKDSHVALCEDEASTHEALARQYAEASEKYAKRRVSDAVVGLADRA